MALSLNMSYCEDNGNKRLVVSDTTGDYDVTTNPTGWGAPNLAKADVEYATIAIQIDSGTQYVIDLIADLGIDFATDVLEFPIANTYLGLTSDEVLPDGIYTITYKVSADPTGVTGVYKTVRNVYLYANRECCIQTLLQEYAENYLCGNCNSPNLDEIFQAYLLHEAGKNAAYCGAQSKVERIGELVDLLCNDINT